MELKNRIWELDFLRGIAFICMVYDHVIYDLNYIFGIKTIQLDFIGDFSAILFMLICGISTTLSRNPLKRGAIVFCAGMMLTGITFLIDSLFNTRLIIVFGILHMLGIAIMVSFVVKKLPNSIIVLISVCIFVLSYYFRKIRNIGNIMFPLGIHDANFYSSDYYPIFPYLAVVFIGIIIGKLFYSSKQSIFPFSIFKNPISFIGKHSLILYLTHQPIVILILFIILKTTGQI